MKCNNLTVYSFYTKHISYILKEFCFSFPNWPGRTIQPIFIVFSLNERYLSIDEPSRTWFHLSCPVPELYSNETFFLYLAYGSTLFELFISPYLRFKSWHRIRFVIKARSKSSSLIRSIELLNWLSFGKVMNEKSAQI